MILVDKNNVLQISGEVTRYGDENDPYEKGVIFFGNAGFGLPQQQLYEVESVPENIEPNKYCYTEEKGFYPNPDYHEPTVYDRVTPEDVLEIEANYTAQLIEEGVI